ncbi:MAG TPA: hemolysin family protein [Patescibacteria group bacterium]|nr:hemolysin family protein [Patescibacteria group bacterium]
MVKVSRTRLEELALQGDQRATLALQVLGNFDTYLGATQLGITLSSLALGWLGEPAISSLIEPYFNDYVSCGPWLSAAVSIMGGFMLITFFYIVFGELVPKSVAIQRAERMALFSVGPLYRFHKLGYPIILLFNRTARAVLNSIGIAPAPENDLTHSEEELRMIVSASHRGGVLDEMESKLIDNVFDFSDRLAREIMIPRQDMVCLFCEESFEESMKTVRETNHTRYPLCAEDKDHIIGMIHIRDLIDFDLYSESEKNLQSVVREVLLVPEAMSVAELLQIMRRKRTHLAIVADEYGGTAGLVALEDIIEQIVGDIQDEHDEEECEILRLPDGSYEFDGGVLLDDVVELLNIQTEEHEEDTIGGYIFGVLGRKPEVGDVVPISPYEFHVLTVNGFRIVRVKATMTEREYGSEYE